MYPMKFKRNLVVLALILGFLFSFVHEADDISVVKVYDRPTMVADSFDFPVGPPDAEGYYNAQPFGTNNHLGDDWNADTGGDTDLGDPVYACATGVVKIAHYYGGGWGNVIRMVHQLPSGHLIESVYAHVDTMLVKKNDQIKKGEQIATIGNADGQYAAHLHFEMRYDIKVPMGGGYSSNPKGYMDPTAFIKANRVVKK